MKLYHYNVNSHRNPVLSVRINKTVTTHMGILKLSCKLPSCLISVTKLQLLNVSIRSYLGTITEKSAVAFSFGGDNLKRYFDQR